MIAPQPLHHISISNFRCLAGNTQLPLNAPVVLIHGPNGTGKTSVLSAIELALTGAVESLKRFDDRYFAHLPHRGEPFAAVEIQIADTSGYVTSPGVMTVGATGREGEPALDRAARQFYSERSYLDQVSLGRLLEMYQHTERNRESSLTRFVNELLGLEQLDTLISGLVDVIDVRNLKNLVGAYAEAVTTAQAAQDRLKTAAKQRSVVRSELQSKEAKLSQIMSELGHSEVQIGTPTGLVEASETIADHPPQGGPMTIESLVRSLSELRGRIQGLATRPSHIRVEEAELRQEGCS